MRIGVVGTRGIPGVHGGVERHCEELYPRIAAAGHDVRVYAREGYVSGRQVFEGVRVEVVSSLRGRGLEAFAHTAAAMRRAAKDGCDVLHVHSVGPSALIPYAKMLGFRRIVATVHAPDYLQRKWGAAAKALLRFGERQAVVGSSAAICVAEWYSRQLERAYGRPVEAIPNGPGLLGMAARRPSPVLEQFGLVEGYALFVGRLVPDKRVEDLIAAARQAGGWQIVVAGDTSDSDEYSRFLKTMSGPDLLFTGYVYGQDLLDLYAHAGAFVLPSSVEGLPISALEAMSLGVPAVMSDIPANREVADAGKCALLYPCGDVPALEHALFEVSQSETREALVAAAKARVADVYDWDRIAASTLAVYERVIAAGDAPEAAPEDADDAPDAEQDSPPV